MGPGGVCVGPSDPTGPLVQAAPDHLHQLLHSRHIELTQPHNIDFLFVVFSAVNELPIVEEIEQLAAVDFVEGDLQHQLRIVVQGSNDVEGSQQVEPWDCPVIGPHHSESFPTSRLSVSKACSLRSLESTINQWFHTQIIDSLVVNIIIKDVVKVKVMFFNILCQINFIFEFLDHHMLISPDLKDVSVILFHFFGGPGPLPHHHSDLGWVLGYQLRLRLLLHLKLNMKLY
mmetsp:Transcript_23584/g.23250  ORF Transcript_23584/g.23250 Transcript_23584/m.23250 type:complete len:230 (-) Transcript_23584:22-711(-)